MSIGHLNLSLFDQNDSPAAPAPVAEPPSDPLTFRIRKTRFGRDILVTEADPAPQSLIDEAERLGLALFTAPEIYRMRGCPDQMVEKIIIAKLTFPGASVESVLEAA